MDLKRCARCRAPKPREAFGRLGPTGLQAYCRVCRGNYYQDNKPKWRQSDLSRRYNLSLADFDALLASQGHSCAICRSSKPGGRGSFHVDHDHTCCPGGKSCGSCVRALLCHGCNVLLGVARDNPRTLTAAAAYLLQHARKI